jgi:hypothetical protein
LETPSPSKPSPQAGASHRVPHRPGITRLAITLPDGSIQHFERVAAGDSNDWRATDFESAGGGCAFNEPITSEWGCGLDAFVPQVPADQQGELT